MKKTFIGKLAAICFSAMVICTVSCTKEIEQDLADLKEEVAGLAQKLNDLENRLNDELGKIKDTIEKAKAAAVTDDAKLKAELESMIAVRSVEKKDGSIILTLANGDRIEVAVPDGNSDNTNLVTIVKVDGKEYWAIVNSDGTFRNTGVEVGHPDVNMSFKIDMETRELLISYNGTDFEGTGVIIKDPDQYDHIVNSVEEKDDCVVLTIGETTITLPKYEALGSITLKKTSVFVKYEESKKVTFTTANVSDLHVIDRPAGWKASVENDAIIVTAPAKSLMDAGFGEKSGEILIHATNASGRCTMTSLSVSTGPVTSISVDNEGNVTVFNAHTETRTQMGETSTDFIEMYAGIIPAEDFLAYGTSEAFFKAAYTSGEIPFGYFGDIVRNHDSEIITYYEEDTNEEMNITLPAEAIAEGIYMQEGIDMNKPYVVWILPVDSAPYYNEAAFAFTKPYVSTKMTESTYNEVKFDVEVYGGDSYFVGAVEKAAVENSGQTLASYLMNGPYYMGGIWTDFMNGNTASLGTCISDGKSQILLSGILDKEPEAENEYYVWVFPYVNDRPVSEYVLADDLMPYVSTFSTAPLKFNENLTASVTDIKATAFTYSFRITPPSGGMTYYNMYSEDEFNKLTEEDLMIEFEYSYPIEEAYDENVTYNVAPGKRYYIVTYSTKEGEKGPIKTYEVETLGLNYSEDMKVTFISMTEDTEAKTYTAEFKVEGASYFAGLNITDNGNTSGKFEEYIMKQNSVVTVMEVPADGTIKVTFAKNNYKKHYFASAFNKNDEGVTALAAKQIAVEIATGNVTIY